MVGASWTVSVLLRKKKLKLLLILINASFSPKKEDMRTVEDWFL